jgi:hypothetical protein
MMSTSSVVRRRRAMASTIDLPVAHAKLATKAAAVARVTSQIPRLWPERLLALVLAGTALILNATLVGVVIGVPLFLVALALLTSPPADD